MRIFRMTDAKGVKFTVPFTKSVIAKALLITLFCATIFGVVFEIIVWRSTQNLARDAVVGHVSQVAAMVAGSEARAIQFNDQERLKTAITRAIDL